MALKEDLDRLMRKKPGRVVAIHEDDAREIVRDAIAPLTARISELEAALQQVTAERDEARAENDRFRAGLANGSGPCAYCNLSREDWTKCRSGFPGCDRADDAMLCPHFGAEMEANDRADAATSELARLRAEGEAKDRALKVALDAYDAAVRESANAEAVRQDVLGRQGDHPDIGEIMDRVGAEEGCMRAMAARGIARANLVAAVRTALAPAATAREG